MLKRGGGVCGSICPWYGGGGRSQLLMQVEEGGPRPCVVNQGARALKVARLIEMGARTQSERFGDFLLQLRVDEK